MEAEAPWVALMNQRIKNKSKRAGVVQVLPLLRGPARRESSS